MDARLIIDEPASGSWNMAVDEALLQSAGQHGSTCLRFYRWSEPTLSLGYFQRLADREQHAASRSLSVVRRATGGGAIVHHHDLTYSLTMPITGRFSSEAGEWVDRFHEALVETLSACGLEASVCDGDAISREAPPFLCFERHYAGDVMVGGSKVAGSAQRRRHGALLQHGSVLLATSTHAPMLRGLAEFGVQVDTQSLQSAWLKEIERRLSTRHQPATLTSNERDAAEQAFATRYGAVAWNAKR